MKWFNELEKTSKDKGLLEEEDREEDVVQTIAHQSEPEQEASSSDESESSSEKQACLGKEDCVIKRQRMKEEFDKLQRKMQRLQREIKLFSSEGSSVLLIRNIITLPWHINQDGFSKEKKCTRGRHTHTFSFNQDFSYSSINTHRSALSLIIDFPEKDKHIASRYFKGIYNLKPPTPKYSFTWDPCLVLVYLEKLYPLEKLSLEKLSHKLVMLMALTSAHRLQTFSLIKIQNISVKSKQVEIRIPDKIKTSGKSKSQPILHFPFFIEKPQLCVASTICHYLEVTKTLRPPSENRLILTIKKPHRAASSQYLSRWLKNILTTCGIDTNIFKTYSTRHAATSAAARAGLNSGPKILRSLINSKHTLVAFLDISGAYDNVDLKILANKMEKVKIPPKLTYHLLSLYNNRKIYIKTNEDVLGPRTTSIGLPQGGILSPLLYIIYYISTILKSTYSYRKSKFTSLQTTSPSALSVNKFPKHLS
nr:unnamed protein product [Callosobruchus chinensis]